MIGQIVAGDHRHLMAQFEILLQAGTPQIEITVFQACILQCISLIGNDERCRLRGIDDLDRSDLDLDITGRQVGILILTLDDLTMCAEHVFVAHLGDLV